MINKTDKYLQNTTQKIKDRTTRITLKTGGELVCSEWVSSSCTCVTLVTNPVISHE
jgi:hypothetical protein